MVRITRTAGGKAEAVDLTPARWRRLDPALRRELRQALGGKAALIGRQVLEVARDLCRHHADGLALDLYRALHGDPSPPYECGLGAMVTLRCHYMGEVPETWLYGSLARNLTEPLPPSSPV